MSLSDLDSDLTNLSSDEEDVPLALSYAPPRERKPKKSREFPVKHSLRPPRTSQFSAKALYGTFPSMELDSFSIDLSLQIRSSRMP